MARIQIDKIVTNISGAPLLFASVTISNINFPATPVSSVYVAATGAATLPTPLLTAADGSIPGFLNPGTYNFGITPQGQATYYVQVDTPSGALTVRSLPTASSEWEGQILTVSGTNTTYICQYNGAAYIWQIMSFSAATPIGLTSLGGDLQGNTTFATVMYVRGATPVLTWKGRVGNVLPTAGDYLASQVSNAGDKATPMSQIFQGSITSPYFQTTGLIGATPQSRWVGGGLSATPVSTGTSFQAGDFISMQSGNMAVYNGAGWIVSGQGSGGGGSGVSAFNTRTGAVTLSKADVTGTGLAAADVGADAAGAGTAATTALLTSAVTFTNKRITNRVVTVTQVAAPAINTDNMDVASITGLAQAITSMTTNLTGTPVDGDALLIRITDNGTSRAITWGAKFESSTVALPSATVISTILIVQFVWNTATSKWRVIGVA